MAKTKIAAIKQGKAMGLEGAHKMPNGMWHPGKTHQTFVNFNKKKTRGG